MELLTSTANLPFTVALAIVVLLGALQGFALLLGGAVDLLDGPDVDTDVDIDGLEGGGLFSHFLEWLHVGRIPLSIILILFLLAFGSSGLLLQNALRTASGAMLPWPVASAIAMAIALPATRLAGGILKPIIPRDETEAVTRDSLLGRSAQITTGRSRRGAPAEAKVRDQYGKTHYVMVEPDHDSDEFGAGSRIVLLKRRDAIYRAIADVESGLDAS